MFKIKVSKQVYWSHVVFDIQVAVPCSLVTQRFEPVRSMLHLTRSETFVRYLLVHNTFVVALVLIRAIHMTASHLFKSREQRVERTFNHNQFSIF